METADPHAEEVLGKAYDARLMRRLLGYLRPYRGRTAAAVGLIVVSSRVQLVGPLATAVAFDLFVAPRLGADGAAHRDRDGGRRLARGAPGCVPRRWPGLAWTAAIWRVVLVATFAVLWLQGYLLQTHGAAGHADLRREVFAHLQRLDLAYFDRNPVGRLVTRVTTDVDALNELFTAGIVSIFGDLLLLVGIAAVLFVLDWRLALAAFAILPLLAAADPLVQAARARQSFREVRVEVARLNAFLQEHMAGMSVVQLFGREAPRARRLPRHQPRPPRRQRARHLLLRGLLPGRRADDRAGPGPDPGVGGARVIGGAVSIGALVAFLQYAQRFYQPLADLSEKYNILQQAMASSERIFQLLDTPATIASPAAGLRARRGARHDRVRPRELRLRAGEPVLRDVSFRVEPGETVAVVGAHRRRQVDARQPPAALLRRRPRARCGSTASTSAGGTSSRSGARSAWCSRTSSCSPARSPATSGWARPGSTTSACSPPRATPRRSAFIERLPGRLRGRGARARRRALGGGEAAPRLRPRARLRPAGPDPRRGHLLGRHRDRAPHPDRRSTACSPAAPAW